MKDFDKIVNKLGNKGGKVIFKKEIFELIDPEYKPEYQSFVNKLIYRLRAEAIILPLKSGVYIIPDTEDRNLNSVDLLEKYYIKLLKKYITEQVGNQYYISGIKSLEFHMKDFSIPERISIINRNLNKKILVGNYEIHFKTISGNTQNSTKNLFSLFYGYHKEVEVSQTVLKISPLELALLEASLVDDSSQGVPVELLTKTLKKYGNILRHEIFYEVGKYKYNMSYNRLKELARHIHPELSQLFLEIIKKNGGCFIGEGLRNM